MQKIKIGIIDREKEYVTSLVAFLQKYGKGKWELCAFTNTQALENHLNKRPLDILIGTDKGVLTREGEKWEGIQLWLAGQECDEKKEREKFYVVYRFQNANGIGKCIERIIQKEQKSTLDDKFIIAIYSPVGRSGKTTLALDIVNSGEYGKWLYFGMEDYSSFENTDDGKQTLTDEILYYWKERKGERVLQLMEQSDNIIVTGTSFLDRRQVDGEDFRWIQSVLAESTYIGILFDIGSGIIQNSQLFGEFDRVIVPYLKEETALVKKQNFEKMLDAEEKECDKNIFYFVDMDNQNEIVKLKQEVFGGTRE